MMTIEIFSLLAGLFTAIVTFLMGLRVILREHREAMKEES